MSDYKNVQKLIAMIFYIAIVIACIITIGGTVWTIADLIMAEGKMELFQGLSFGFQIAIISALLAGLFFVIIIFYGLAKKGVKLITKLIYKERKLPGTYRDRLAVKIVAAGLMLCIFAIIIGLISAVFYEVFIGSLSRTFQFVGDFSWGQIVLFTGIVAFLVIGLIFTFVWMWHNGRYLVIRMIWDLEKEKEK